MTLGQVINQRNGMCGLCKYDDDYANPIPGPNARPNSRQRNNKTGKGRHRNKALSHPVASGPLWAIIC